MRDRLNTDIEKTATNRVRTKRDVYLHGTNSAVLTLLPHTQFELLSPAHMIQKYHLASFNGEIIGGGMQTARAGSSICFAELSKPDGSNYYTLKTLISHYASVTSHHTIRIKKRDELINDIAKEVQDISKSLFARINILLIFLARAKQMGISNEDFANEAQLATMLKQLDAVYHYYYFLLIIGRYIKPAYDLLNSLNKEDKDNIYQSIKTYFGGYTGTSILLKKISESGLDIKAIYENPTAKSLQLIEDLLVLPKEMTLKKTVDGKVTERNVVLAATRIFVSTGQELAQSTKVHDVDYFVFGMFRGDGGCDINNLLFQLATKWVNQHFIDTFHQLITEELSIFEQKRLLVRELLNKAPIDMLTETNNNFITEPFPLIFVCADNEKIKLSDPFRCEYRCDVPLNLGTDITFIATDSESNLARLRQFLQMHQLTNVKAILFSDLARYKYLRTTNNTTTHMFSVLGIADLLSLEHQEQEHDIPDTQVLTTPPSAVSHSAAAATNDGDRSIRPSLHR